MRLACALLAGCWTSSTSPATPVAEAPPSAFEITLERGTCFGRCPAYRVSIDGDGRVHWFGIENVHDHGDRHATVPRRRIAELERKLAALRFFERDPLGNLPDPGNCDGTSCTFTDTTICSSTSTATLVVRSGNRRHVVRNDHCAPSPLEELEAMIDDIARTSAWIGGRVDSPAIDSRSMPHRPPDIRPP